MRMQKRIGPVLLAVSVFMVFGIGTVPAVGLDAPVFGAASMVQDPGAPRDVAVADFNEDGRDDVVSAIMTSGSSTGIALSFGGVDPVLSAPQMIDTTGPTWSVVATDLDGDGHADIAASLSQGSGIVVLLGQGDGTFSEAVVHATGQSVRGLALADIDGNGWTDVVGTEPDLPGVVVLSGDAGSFTVGEHQVPGSGYVLEVAAGQLVGDGLPDLAVADNFGARVLVLENTGTGFSIAQTLATGEQPRDAVVADMNGDGNDDVIASSSLASDVEVFLADGVGGFADPIIASAGDESRTGALAALDLDVDGDIDVVAANASTGVIVALENDGSGHLQTIDSLSVASGPTAITIGNPDGDTIRDIVVADFGDACVRVISSPQTVISSLYRLPAPAPDTLATIEVAGATRYETAIEASKLAFPDGTEHLIVASGENWPDAVTASALAGRLHAPLLLTHRTGLPSAVADEVRRLGSADAIVIGGEAAVSEVVVSTLKTLVSTGEVRRLAGLTRYETADAVAREVVLLAGDAYDGRSFVATGRSFADALAVSPLANASGSPVFLTPPDGRPGLTDEMLNLGTTDVVILGGTPAISAVVEDEFVNVFGAKHVGRLAGADRYATAAAVAEYGVSNDGLGWDGVGLATGIDFPDALAGGSMLGSRGSVMLLTLPDHLSDAAAGALSEHADEVNTVVFLGGSSAIGIGTRTAATSALR